MIQYRLTTLLGVGSFAEVWRAERVNAAGEPCAPPVALKVALCGLGDERSERERTALFETASLRDEGIIRVLDIMGTDRLMIALELAEKTLLQRIQEGLTTGESVRYIAEIAATLDDLHARGFINGGINPTDILIRNEQAKLSDFGPISYDSAPFYKAVCMAPEVREKKPRPESDQYALASTYAWSRLHPSPFLTRPSAFVTGAAPETGGRIDVCQLPPVEQEVVSTALNLRPEKRFPSCRAFAYALEQACGRP